MSVSTQAIATIGGEAVGSVFSRDSHSYNCADAVFGNRYRATSHMYNTPLYVVPPHPCTYVKLVSKSQRIQQLRNTIVWSGCGTFSFCNPLRVIVHLGDLKVASLVDSGSDYDAIDQDLSQLQATNGNVSFISRSEVANKCVYGFSLDMERSSNFESEWNISFSGALVLNGKQVVKELPILFSEFKELGDPIIFGMPTIDALGGLEVTAQQIWLCLDISHMDMPKAK